MIGLENLNKIVVTVNVLIFLTSNASIHEDFSSSLFLSLSLSFSFTLFYENLIRKKNKKVIKHRSETEERNCYDPRVSWFDKFVEGFPSLEFLTSSRRFGFIYLDKLDSSYPDLTLKEKGSINSCILSYE